MAKQDEKKPEKPELTVNFLEQNLVALNGSANQIKASAMYEAGRKAGQVEGQQLLLTNMVKMFGVGQVPGPKLAKPGPKGQ